MTFDLIIFDNDGTLSDSEEMNCTVTSDILMSYGLEKYTPEYCVQNMAGKSMPILKEMVEQEHGIKLPDDFIQSFIDRVMEKIPRILKPVDGAVDAVRKLSHAHKICVASNGEPENVEACIDKIGLMDVFGIEHVYTKSQVANGKPAPDLFLFAAGKMGVSPERTIVIEDTPTGVRAGKAAGMKVIGITAVAHDHTETKNNLLAAGADVVFESWDEIEDYITTACG